MAKYRKRPVIVDAEVWRKVGDVADANITPIDADWTCKECGQPAHKHGNCPTLEGYHIVCPGDWIIRGVVGEYYPCKPYVFAMTYEIVT